MADVLSNLKAAILRLQVEMRRRRKKKQRPQRPGGPRPAGPNANKGCGTGAGGFGSGNSCAKEDGIPNAPRKPPRPPKGLGPVDAKADFAKAKAMKEKFQKKQAEKIAAAKAKSEAYKKSPEYAQKQKQKRIDSLRRKAAAKKAEKGARDAAEKQAASEAAAKKRAAMLQKIRIKKANEKLQVAGTPKSIKQEIEELKAKKASEQLKVVGTPKTVREELQELKARIAAGKQKAPQQAAAQQGPPSLSIGDELKKPLSKANDEKLDKEREIVFGAQNKEGWKFPVGSHSAAAEAAKRVKHEIATDLASRIAKSGIKESDVSDEMLLHFDKSLEFYGSTAAKERLMKAGIPETMHRRYALAAGMTRTWAETSGDSYPPSVGVQFAIRKELKITGAATRHFAADAKKHNKPWGKSEEDVVKKIQNDKSVRAVVRAQYEATQDRLKASGVKELTLARGYEGAGKVDYAGEQDVLLQPASSFSMSKNVASNFMGTKNKMRGVVATIPASRVFSTSVTGFGCLREQEIVVLGGKLRGRVIGPKSAMQW